jgi:hypothetical protein
MAFTKKLGLIRYYGRKVVLPSDKIKKILTEEVFRDNIAEGCMIDFGAGTLYWSKWFYRYIKKVIAVDIYYKNSINEGGIIYQNNLRDALDIVDESPCIIWMSDVLHHLNRETYKEIFSELTRMDYVIIKDIDCNHKFGNFMNRMHDRIINHERIMDVDPMKLIELLEKRGFEVKKFYLPKLWYPHFLLIAKKS